MTKSTLTDVKLRNLKPDGRARIEIWDSQLPGFGVRVSQTGTKSFILLYRMFGRPRRMTLGRYPQLSLAEARVAAREAMNAVANDVDPQADTKIKVKPGEPAPSKTETRSKHRLDKVIAEFVIKHCQRNNRASTAHETARVLNAHLTSQWPARDIRKIEKSDIHGLLDDLVEAGKPSAANHALAAIRKFFNWCVERGYIDTSPCLGIKSPTKAVSRSRVLNDQELAKIWQASFEVGAPFGSIVRLLLTTGQRRSEVGSLRWENIDMDEALWTLPAEHNKSGRIHSVPLTKIALAELKSVSKSSEIFVFPSLRSPTRCFSGFSKCKIRLDALSGVTDWTLHDLRRTVATGLASMKVPPYIVEKLLNHSSGSFSGVAGVYNRFEYREEIRDALHSWEQHITNLLAQEEAL